MKKRTLGSEYVSSFCLEMALLLHAGISTEDGLYLLSEDETNKKNKRMLEEMAQMLGEGRALSEALREAGHFPKYVGDMVETGERSGRLEQSFQALSSYYDRQMQLTNQIRNALLYPVILMLLMLVIIVVLLVKVLPIFNQVYEQLGGTMSGTAQLLLEVGNALGSAMPVLCIVLGAVILLAIVIGCSSVLRGGIIHLYKKVFGDMGITRRLGESRFASAMAMGMMSGLNTEEAFRTAMLFQDTVPRAKRRYEKCLQMLEAGDPMAECFRENSILETSYCRILDLGAKSGTSDTAMEEIARRMEDNVQTLIEAKVGRIEPTIVIITSILVGIVLIAVMLPLINIMSSIG